MLPFRVRQTLRLTAVPIGRTPPPNRRTEFRQSVSPLDTRRFPTSDAAAVRHARKWEAGHGHSQQTLGAPYEARPFRCVRLRSGPLHPRRRGVTSVSSVIPGAQSTGSSMSTYRTVPPSRCLLNVDAQMPLSRPKSKLSGARREGHCDPHKWASLRRWLNRDVARPARFGHDGAADLARCQVKRMISTIVPFAPRADRRSPPR